MAHDSTADDETASTAVGVRAKSGVCEIAGWGRMVMAWSESGLILLGLPDRAPGEHLGRLGARGVIVESTPEVPEKFRDPLRAYCDGDPDAVLAIPIAPLGTDFQLAVWAAMRAIPIGETRTYAAMARTVARPGANRAVGNACGANLIGIVIPCHRVISTGGGVGGFAAGIPWKQRLLQHEMRIRARRESA